MAREVQRLPQARNTLSRPRDSSYTNKMPQLVTRSLTGRVLVYNHVWRGEVGRCSSRVFNQSQTMMVGMMSEVHFKRRCETIFNSNSKWAKGLMCSSTASAMNFPCIYKADRLVEPASMFLLAPPYMCLIKGLYWQTSPQPGLTAKPKGN